MPQKYESHQRIDNVAVLMQMIGRMVATIHHIRQTVKIQYISENDELFGAISYIFPIDHSSIEDIDAILDHPSFKSLADYSSERNMDVKNVLVDYANKLSSIFSNNPISSALTMSESLS